MDGWIERRLAEAELQPAPEADRVTLVRRVTLDLTGLPPTPDEVTAFASDANPDAYERLVDRLLASPRHGERAAQGWLDVVRYAETEGYEYDSHRAGAWRFRDYVIASFNRDKPFDRFALEQLAGDELASVEFPNPERSAGDSTSSSVSSPENAWSASLSGDGPIDRERELRIAVGFHRLGPIRRNAGNSDVAFSRNEVLTEMTDALGAVFLGLTLGCARCHDHKFDPIRQTDYYRLQAFLAPLDEDNVSLAPPDAAAQWKAETKRITDAMKQLRLDMQEAQGERRKELAERYAALERSLPAPLPTISSMRNQAERPASVRRLERGDTERPRETLQPRVLGVLAAADPARFAELPADVASPKTRLAEWLFAREHPLTSRVLANRLWQAHFGTGLVATPNDFGMNGAAPSHPELLDWLANRLAQDWSVKAFRRLLVTSSAYRQASRVASSGDTRGDRSGRDRASPSAGERAAQLDPNNAWLWHYPRRRLDAETVRDALLAISGQLDLSMGGPSVIPPVDRELVDLLYKPDQWEVTVGDAARHRRSIYLIAKRNLRIPLLETFDQPDSQTSCGRRMSSTHAPQALELLNGEFANEQAAALAARLEREGGVDVAARVELAFRLAAGRPPTNVERRLSAEFLSRNSPREFALAVLNLNAVLYVE